MASGNFPAAVSNLSHCAAGLKGTADPFVWWEQGYNDFIWKSYWYVFKHATMKHANVFPTFTNDACVKGSLFK